jgi:hypothetical protein
MVTAMGGAAEEVAAELGEEDGLGELCRDDGAEEETEMEVDGEGEDAREDDREDELCRELGAEPAAG